MTDTPVPQTPEELIHLPGEETPTAPAEAPAPPQPSVRTVEGLEHLALQFLLAEATELAAAGHYSEAEARLSAIKDGRKNPQVLDLLARIRAQQGRNAEAIEFWQMAVQMDPANADYRAGLDRLRRPRCDLTVDADQLLLDPALDFRARDDHAMTEEFGISGKQRGQSRIKPFGRRRAMQF